MNNVLTTAERSAIRAVASGDKSQMPAAKAAYDRAVSAHGINACVELQFMSEVLAPVPDLLLRAQYRSAVTKQSS